MIIIVCFVEIRMLVIKVILVQKLKAVAIEGKMTEEETGVEEEERQQVI